MDAHFVVDQAGSGPDQVCVAVDEAWEHHFSSGVERVGMSADTARRSACATCGDAAVFDKDGGVLKNAEILHRRAAARAIRSAQRDNLPRTAYEN